MKHLMCFKVFTIMLTSTKSQCNNSSEDEGCIIHCFIDKETKLKEAKQFDQCWLMSFQYFIKSSSGKYTHYK